MESQTRANVFFLIIFGTIQPSVEQLTFCFLFYDIIDGTYKSHARPIMSRGLYIFAETLQDMSVQESTGLASDVFVSLSGSCSSAAAMRRCTLLNV